jgi:hypothetical protein
MIRFITARAIIAAAFIGATTFIAAPALAAPDKAAVQDATAKCKAQVNEEAKFKEISWLAKRRMVKKCVNDILAGH